MTATASPTAAAATLAAFATGLQADHVPAEVRAAAVLHLLDTVGCGLAATALGVATQGRTVALEDGGAAGSSTIGLPQKVPAQAAAFANGMLCHGLDFDDTHPGSIAHIGTVVGPAALAAAEAADASGAELVTALVAGTEVVARVGIPAARAYMKKGFHPTSVCGVFGATAAAARLCRLSADRTVAALGIAGSMAAGLFEYLEEGTETKPIHAGWAAHGGIVAARLARLGAAGPSTVLEGRFGLFASYFDDPGVDFEAHLADLGRAWETPRVSFKPYPACHFVHSCVDAARDLRTRASVRPADIEEVVVSIPAPGVPLVLEPDDHKRRPRTPYDAKFSLPYSVAAMLVRGRVDVASYTGDAIKDPAVLDLAARVSYAAGDFPTYPAAFPGRVEIRLRDGSALTEQIDHQRGGEANPMAAGDVLEKFRANAALALAPTDAEALEAGIIGLDAAPDLSQLEPLRRAHPKEGA
jgi:2-methylcitrate dehydratase PrpD